MGGVIVALGILTGPLSFSLQLEVLKLFHNITSTMSSLTTSQRLQAYLKPTIRRTMLSQYRPNNVAVTVDRPDLQREVYLESQMASPRPISGMSAL